MWEEKLGQASVAKLTHLLETGAIERSQVKELSYEHNMNVNPVYNDSHDKEENIVLTMERMLDRWYEMKVYSLSPSEARDKLLEILSESHCSPFVVDEMRKACKTGGEGQSSGDKTGSGSNIEE